MKTWEKTVLGRSHSTGKGPEVGRRGGGRRSQKLMIAAHTGLSATLRRMEFIL